MKINSVIQEKIAVVTPVTDQEINTFYTENPDKFQAPEEIRASHILLTVSADDTPEAKEQKRQQLADLRSKIEKGSDFAALAKDNSECPSKEKGGDLGFFSRGRMVKPFEDAAFSLKDGEMSPVIETQFGYHLIKVTERKAARNIPLEEVKSRLSDYLKQQKEEQAVDSFLQQLRQDAKIEYADKTAP